MRRAARRRCARRGPRPRCAPRSGRRPRPCDCAAVCREKQRPGRRRTPAPARRSPPAGCRATLISKASVAGMGAERAGAAGRRRAVHHQRPPARRPAGRSPWAACGFGWATSLQLGQRLVELAPGRRPRRRGSAPSRRRPSGAAGHRHRAHDRLQVRRHRVLAGVLEQPRGPDQQDQISAEILRAPATACRRRRRPAPSASAAISASAAAWPACGSTTPLQTSPASALQPRQALRRLRPGPGEIALVRRQRPPEAVGAAAVEALGQAAPRAPPSASPARPAGSGSQPGPVAAAEAADPVLHPGLAPSARAGRLPSAARSSSQRQACRSASSRRSGMGAVQIEPLPTGTALAERPPAAADQRLRRARRRRAGSARAAPRRPRAGRRAGRDAPRSGCARRAADGRDARRGLSASEPGWGARVRHPLARALARAAADPPRRHAEGVPPARRGRFPTAPRVGRCPRRGRMPRAGRSGRGRCRARPWRGGSGSGHQRAGTGKLIGGGAAYPCPRHTVTWQCPALRDRRHRSRPSRRAPASSRAGAATPPAASTQPGSSPSVAASGARHPRRGRRGEKARELLLALRRAAASRPRRPAARPARASSQARASSVACSATSVAGSRPPRRCGRSGWRRMVPLAEQGASSRIASNGAAGAQPSASAATTSCGEAGTGEIVAQPAEPRRRRRRAPSPRRRRPRAAASCRPARRRGRARAAPASGPRSRAGSAAAASCTHHAPLVVAGQGGDLRAGRRSRRLPVGSRSAPSARRPGLRLVRHLQREVDAAPGCRCASAIAATASGPQAAATGPASQSRQRRLRGRLPRARRRRPPPAAPPR